MYFMIHNGKIVIFLPRILSEGEVEEVCDQQAYDFTSPVQTLKASSKKKKIFFLLTTP